MIKPIATAVETPIEYPDSDGEPMAENTLQWEWIATIKGGLEVVFARDPNVFVAGDLLWYPVEGQPTIRRAPDTLVAFGRPKGYRGSYQQWEEGGIAPQVVFEVLSPGNTPEEMERKLDFYRRYCVEEYYIYDPETAEMAGYLRRGADLEPIESLHGWVSPRLEVRFDLSGPELVIYAPNGDRFLTYLEQAEGRMQAVEDAKQAHRQRVQAARRAALVFRQRLEAEQRAEEAVRQSQEAQARADEATRQTQEAQARAERLAARLRELGIDPDA